MIGTPLSVSIDLDAGPIAIERLVITGGGTAGHVYPAFSVLDEIQGKAMWIGSTNGREKQLIERSCLPFVGVPTGAILGRNPVQTTRSIIANVRGIGAALTALRQFNPKVVLGTGGYVTVPTVIAARLLGIPSALFLPDIQPGLAVRWLSRLADRVACTSEKSRRFLSGANVTVTGYPVRAELRQWAKRPRADAFATLGLPTDRPVILIFGGSTGAHAINQAIFDGLRELLYESTVVHVTGDADRGAAGQQHEALPDALRQRYWPFAYLDDEMGAALSAADLVICRAGASTLGELPAFGKPSILIPGTFASGHQGHNADALVDLGAAVRVNENELASPSYLPRQALALIRDPNRRDAMARAARSLDHPNASRAIAQILKELEKKR